MVVVGEAIRDQDCNKSNYRLTLLSVSVLLHIGAVAPFLGTALLTAIPTANGMGINRSLRHFIPPLLLFGSPKKAACHSPHTGIFCLHNKLAGRRSCWELVRSTQQEFVGVVGEILRR